MSRLAKIHSMAGLMRILGATTALFLLSVTVSYGQQDSKAKACGLYDAQTEMNLCYAKEAREADAALNATYQKLISRLKDDKVALAKLIASERAWVAFRDANIAAMWPVGPNEDANVTYGSVHPMCVSIALAGMTYQRRRDLEERLTRQEGNVCSDAVAGCTPKPSPRNPGSSETVGTR